MFPIKINFNTYLEKSVFPPTNHAKVSYLVQAEETFLTGFFLRKTAGVVPHPKSWFYCHLAEDLSQFPLIVNCILCSTIKTGWRILVSFLTLWFCAYFSIIFIQGTINPTILHCLLKWIVEFYCCRGHICHAHFLDSFHFYL